VPTTYSANRKARATIVMVATLVTVLFSMVIAATTAEAAPPQNTWARIGRAPLSDAKAASLVTHEPEVRSGNVVTNNYVPSRAQLRTFYNARDNTGKPIVKVNRWFAYVTGRPGLKNPSTGDLIQWTAYKWGIPVNPLRALLVDESWWMTHGLPALGDRTFVSRAWYYNYPPEARISYRWVWQSMGIAQERWSPDQSKGAGSNPLRYLSTAFSLDYLGASLRYFYDGKCNWCGGDHHAGQGWASIGAWNEPKPWGNRKMLAYIARIKHELALHRWTSSDWPN